ncbi:MAG TPA: hypothetical protein PKU97_09565 [Kofleriaceae bacterium]|nr:hypothetical protein [Kofleriaceae bacterium]
MDVSDSNHGGAFVPDEDVYQPPEDLDWLTPDEDVYQPPEDLDWLTPDEALDHGELPF